MVEAGAQERIRQVIDLHFEWLLVPDDGNSFPINCTEIDIIDRDEKVLFGFVDDRGYHAWRLNDFSEAENGLKLDLAGAFGRKRTQFRLVPRTSARELAEEIEAARLLQANDIARGLRGAEFCKTVNRVALSRDNARVAEIFFRSADDAAAAIADVSRSITSEMLLSTAILRWEALSSRKKDRIETLWIIAEKKQARDLQSLHAMLSRMRKRSIRIAEIERRPDTIRIKELRPKRLSDLWRGRTKPLSLPDDPTPSSMAREILAMAPQEIDVIFSRQGETLRFRGLPFARVRKTLGVEKGWFGVDRRKKVFGPESKIEMEALIDELRLYRRSDPENPRHEFYRLAPEAWLESILRRNIKLLDANIILSPIYNQFRASNDRIDLLALRRDGRLVIVELKTSPDREMIFQAADYWRKIELQRRRGKLQDSDLFAGREIIDKPALIYLAAPAWSFHAEFAHFARMIDPEVEIWRFELHENWRREVKVVARQNYSDPLSGFTNL